MSTLYLDRQQGELRVTRHHLEVRIPGEQVQRFPLHLLKRVIIMQVQSIDTRSLARLAGAGIAVQILHGRREMQLASVVGLAGGDVQRRLEQYAAWRDRQRAAGWVRVLLQSKLHGQDRVIRRMLHQRPDRRKVLQDSLQTLQVLQNRLARETLAVEPMRGLEGAASAAGFRALAAVLPPSLGFVRRQRRPPPDPVNAVLSLGYTLAHGMALETIHAAGLDPYLGYLHEPLHGRFSFAADWMEPLRPRIEYFAWTLFRERKLTAAHFRETDEGCRLDKAGRARFYGAWERQAAGWRRGLRKGMYGFMRQLGESGHVHATAGNG